MELYITELSAIRLWLHRLLIVNLQLLHMDFIYSSILHEYIIYYQLINPFVTIYKPFTYKVLTGSIEPGDSSLLYLRSVFMWSQCKRTYNTINPHSHLIIIIFTIQSRLLLNQRCSVDKQTQRSEHVVTGSK